VALDRTDVLCATTASRQQCNDNRQHANFQTKSMARKISRTDVNFLLDALLLLLFIAVCVLSVILEFVFPPGTQADGWLLWNSSFNEWSRLRFYVLASMAAAVVLHVMLHWTWVCGVLSSRLGGKSNQKSAKHDDPSRTLWGVGLLIVIVNLVGAVIAAAALMIRGPTPGP
jgi:heme/copper-type cytochrome/quinol oxidase subunit 2